MPSRTTAPSVPVPVAENWPPTPPQESFIHKAGLAQSPVGSVLLSPGSWHAQDFVCVCPPRICFLESCGSSIIKSHCPSKSDSLSLVQSLSHVWLFVTPWTAAHQASLSITNSQSLLRLRSIKLVMPSNHLILSSPSPAFNLSQQQALLKWVSFSHQVAKTLEFQLRHQSFQWIFRTDFL